MKRDELEETPGSRIRALRGKQTLEAFASAVGVSRQAVAKWEANQAVPRAKQLKAIGKAYSVDPVFIAFGVAHPDAQSTIELALNEKIMMLNEQQKRVLLDVVNSILKPGVDQETLIEEKRENNNGNGHGAA
tara:strand:+ start:944 stop:1339 length:396 start_codon:yes stop_codon:yes gene_type:complete